MFSKFVYTNYSIYVVKLKLKYYDRLNGKFKLVFLFSCKPYHESLTIL